MSEGWEISYESIAAMNETAAYLEEVVEGINKEVIQLKNIFEDNREGLGPHSADIASLLEDLGAVCEEAANPVKILVLKLTRAALIRTKILEQNGYTKTR